MDAGNSGLKSLVLATDVDVLPVDREVVRRDGYVAVRSQSNPAHFFGNFLIFDAPPGPGDRDRWLACFAAELPGSEHRAFAWDVRDGAMGAAREEFPEFRFDQLAGLVAAPTDLTPHPRASEAVSVRALGGSDDPGWDAVLALSVTQNAEEAMPHPEEHFRRYKVRRLAELAALFAAGRGHWFVAERDGELAGSLGVVVTGGRARYQDVVTARAFRGQGIASRLVIEAAQRIIAEFRVDALVICADVDYHALGIYESLGFRRTETVSSCYRPPAAD